MLTKLNFSAKVAEKEFSETASRFGYLNRPRIASAQCRRRRGRGCPQYLQPSATELMHCGTHRWRGPASGRYKIFSLTESAINSADATIASAMMALIGDPHAPLTVFLAPRSDAHLTLFLMVRKSNQPISEETASRTKPGGHA